MYDFHYNYIKQKYSDRAKLLFTDTDSLCYKIQTEDAYKDVWIDRDKFDNSDYDKSSSFFDANNKKVIGKMKDEAAGVPITEFVALCSKCILTSKKAVKTKKQQRVLKSTSYEKISLIRTTRILF